MKMRNFLLRLAEKITGKQRYRPEDHESDHRLHWSSKVWVSNVFRAHEWLFGRPYGIRAESSSGVKEINGKLHVHYELYTLEALLSHIEVTIRSYFLLWQSFLTFPQYELNYRPIYLTIGILGLVFSIKTPQHLLPLFGLSIALDATSKGTATGTSPLTWSHTCTGSNLILIFGGVVGGSSPTISTPTYNSVSMTLAGSQESNSTGITGLYYLLGPSTGSHTVSVAFGGTFPACQAGVVSWSGVKQTGQPDATAGNTGTSANPSLTVTTVADNSWVAGVVMITNNTPTAGLTSRQALTSGGSFSVHGNLEDTNGVVHPAGNQTVNWTAGSTSIWAASAASFAPVSNLTISVSDSATTFENPSYALSYDGSQNYVTVSDSSSLDITTNLTVEATINISGDTSPGEIVKKDGQYILRTNSNGTQLQGNVWTANNGNVALQGSITAGVQHHVAITYDGSTVRLLLDGSVLASSAATGAISTTSNSLYIGADPNHSEYTNGTIDEVRVSNTARYTGSYTVPTYEFANDANTIALYHFDEGNGSTANDSSGNGNTGTLTHNGAGSNPSWVGGLVQASPNIDLISLPNVSDSTTTSESNLLYYPPQVFDSTTTSELMTPDLIDNPSNLPDEITGVKLWS